MDRNEAFERLATKLCGSANPDLVKLHWPRRWLRAHLDAQEAYDLIARSIPGGEPALLALIAGEAVVVPTRGRFRHRKRGTLYSRLDAATAQCNTGPIQEGDTVSVYVGDDGRLWCRREAEFDDGRFEAVGEGAASPYAGGGDG